MALNKIGNEYADMLDEIYTKTPKAVLAAIAVSYAMLIYEINSLNPLVITDAILDEWKALHSNGIVKQRPPNGNWQRTKEQLERDRLDRQFEKALELANKIARKVQEAEADDYDLKGGLVLRGKGNE